VPLLLLAFLSGRRDAAWLVSLASLIGVSVNFHYLRLVMPLPAVFAVVAGQALLWLFVVAETRRLVVRYEAWWTAFVYPFLWAAVDTIMAAALPDGNWSSVAYSQSDVLPVLQSASLFGVAGLLFLVALVPSTLALAIAYRSKLRRGWIAYAATALLLVASVCFGIARLRHPVQGNETTFGIVSIDDAIGLKASTSYSANILQQYERLVSSLASQGAQVIVLPEKVGVQPDNALSE
jgi:apolipoprotein N-acyltransferase